MIARHRVALSIALASVGAPMFAHAGIDVGTGSTMAFGDGALDFGCADLTIEGTVAGVSGSMSGVANVLVSSGSLSLGAGRLMLGGNFADAGTFTTETSAVDIVDACGSGTSVVSGSTSFYDLVVVTASGKRLVLPALRTQSVAHALTLQGAASELLQVSSSVAGQQAQLNVNPAAAQIIAYVDARDDRASGATIAPGTPASYHSVDDGDLSNWFGTTSVGPGGGNVPVPAPSLNPLARLALLAGMLLLAWRRRGCGGRTRYSRLPAAASAGTLRQFHSPSRSARQ